MTRRRGHLREAESARQQLARPFRYANDLAHAHARQAAIGQQMQARQAAEPTSAEPSTPDGGGLDAQSAEALRLARQAQAQPVDPTRRSTPPRVLIAQPGPHPPPFPPPRPAPLGR